MKEEKTRNGTYDGNTTLRRKAAATHSSGPLTELQKIRRQNVDSGYSTSDGYDKRWSQELATSNGTPTAVNATTTVTDNGNASKWSPTQTQTTILNSEKQSPSAAGYSQFQPHSSGNSTPTMSSPAGSNNNTLTSNQSCNISDYIKPSDLVDNTTPTRSLNGNNRFVSKPKMATNCSYFHFIQPHHISPCAASYKINLCIFTTILPFSITTTNYTHHTHSTRLIDFHSISFIISYDLFSFICLEKKIAKFYVFSHFFLLLFFSYVSYG